MAPTEDAVVVLEEGKEPAAEAGAAAAALTALRKDKPPS